MIGLIARRLARVVVVVVVVAVVASLLAEAAPGTPAERAARAGGILPADDSPIPSSLRRDLLDRVAAQHDLERPLAARVARYVVGLAVLDMGTSWRDGTPVRTILRRGVVATSVLVALSLLFALALGIGAAVVAASRPGGPADVAIGVATAVAIALPPVWIAMIALRTLAAGEPLSLFPASGLGSFGALVLPLVSMMLVPVFVVSRYARAVLVDASSAAWAVAAQARGATRRRVVAVHALKASAAQLLPLLSIITAYLFGSSMVIERVFGIRGVGAVLLDASSRGDAPVIVGVCVVVGGAIALVSGVADVVAYLLDPRERSEVVDGA